MNFFRHILEAYSTNLYDYRDENLKTVSINGTDYRIKPKFQPKIIVALSFGGDTNEDSYNHILAEDVKIAQNFYGDIPVLGQTEVVKFMETDSENYHRLVDQSEEAFLRPDFPTTHVLEDALKIIEEECYNKDSVLFIAHNAHMERVLYTGRKLGLDGEPLIRENIEWPDNDRHHWVNGPDNWWLREILSRLHHRLYLNVPGIKTVMKYLGL